MAGAHVISGNYHDNYFTESIISNVRYAIFSGLNTRLHCGVQYDLVLNCLIILIRSADDGL